MMAISVEHLGAQVQCPHCAAVVQTPPRSALGPPPGPDPYGAAVQPAPSPPQYQPLPPQYEAPAPSIQVPERESIFSDPEPSEDLFGADDTPKVQMPEPARMPQYDADAVATVEDPVEEEEEQVDLAAMRSRVSQARKAGNVAPTLLVFLVPYAIFTTAFLAYLLYTWPKLEAFEWLTDPNKKNPTKAVYLPKHDLPIPAKLKVPLKDTIRVGQMEITPLKVLRTPQGDLVLEFKARNVSTNLVMKPLDSTFFDEGKSNSGKAGCFTFLEQPGGKESSRIYGGHLEFLKGNNQVKIDDERWPGLQRDEECIVHLSTDPGDETRERVQSILKSDAKYQWRLQFRRGTAAVHGVELPVTAVIGIEFSQSEIGK